METFDKASIAGVVAFLQKSRTTARKVLAELLKDAKTRSVARELIERYEKAEKQTAAPETKEAATPPQPEARKSEFSAGEEQQRKRKQPWIDPERTKDWLKPRR